MSFQDPTIVLILTFSVLAVVIIAAWQISRRRAAARVEALRRHAMMTGFDFRQDVLRLDRDDLSGLDSSLSEPLKSMHLFRPSFGRLD